MPYKNKEDARAWRGNDAYKKRRAESSRQYRLRNKEKLVESGRQDYLKNKDKIKKYLIKNKIKIREGRIKYLYGITEDDYQNLLQSQKGICAICGGQNPEPKRLEVDHDHVTGRVRALLCGRCNKVLGMVYEEPTLLNRMANYLSYHKGDPK